MSSVRVLRPNLTVEDVRAALRERLPSRYSITPAMASKGFTKEVPGDANALLVKGRWLARANVRIIRGPSSTEIEVSPGATYPGLIRLADRIGIVREVQRALADYYGT